MVHKLLYIVFLGFLILIGSCRQDEDMYAPEISFTEPSAGAIVDLPDTLEVRVVISDYRVVRTAVLTLVNEDKIPVIPGKYYYPDSTNYIIKASLPLDDISLASGPYNLLVTVSDGKAQKNKYLPIILHEVPQRLQAYIAVTGQFNFKSTVVKLDPGFEPDTQFVFPHGYWLSAVQSLWGEFLFVTAEPSSLMALNPETFETEWEMEAALPRPLITALIPDQQLVCSTANGDAVILSDDGDVIMRTEPFENKTIVCLAADEKFIYAAHVSLSGDIHEMTVFSRLNGDIWEQRFMPGEIRSFVPATGKLLIFLQSSSGAEIMDYDPESFILTEMNLLPDENIKSAIKISDNQIFILTEKKVISYKPESNQLADFKGQPYKFCRYDPLSDIVFLALDTTLFGFNRNTGDLMEAESFPEEILDFQILYNK